ncbi:hypothetical protein ABIA06_003310 [Bradyrhizobium yuanmingense]
MEAAIGHNIRNTKRGGSWEEINTPGMPTYADNAQITTPLHASSALQQVSVTIYIESGLGEYVYHVSKGAVRAYKLPSDGRRQIGPFHLPGDIFGFENGGVHRFCHEGRYAGRCSADPRGTLLMQSPTLTQLSGARCSA